MDTQRMDTYQTGEQKAPDYGYDYQQYDRIWQRVLPELNTFPEERGEDGQLPGTPLPDDGDLGDLPGAQENPCCMGTAAQQSIGVIVGFTENEIALCRFYRCLIPHAPTQRAAAVLRRMLQNTQDNVRRLRAVYYLITAACFRADRQIPMPLIQDYCVTLRGAYHEETCTSLNYFRAAVGAPDPCLRALFERLGRAHQENAEAMVNLLGAVIC